MPQGAMSIGKWSVGLMMALLAASAQAFEWSPLEFPAGPQGYTLEMISEGNRIIIDINISERGGSLDVTTTLTMSQEGVAPGNLADAILGGPGFGMLAFGPMMLFGPSFFVLPMLLEGQDIAVNPIPTRIMGLGTLTMEREEVVAGRTCVVLKLDMTQGDEVEFAVAEGVPFPCFSRYGSGADTIEIRLIEVR